MGSKVDKANADAGNRSDEDRERALNRIRQLRRPLPDCWKFDRDEANRR
jgi:hypothetical protein